MNGLSVVIITYNEEQNIGKCIESVKQVADEILVVDSFSSDRTPAIAIAAGARLLYHKFEGHIEQKNFARKKAAGDWVLSLDADETLSHELLALLITWKNEPADTLADGYTMNRLNFYCGKSIKTCGMYPDNKLRLWKRDAGQWQGQNPHDKFVLNPGNTSAFMPGDILHNTWPSYYALVSSVNKFAAISAQHLKNRAAFYLLLKMIFSPPFKFIKIYFFQLGFTEGTSGLTICYQQSREVFLKYFKALQLKLN